MHPFAGVVAASVCASTRWELNTNEKTTSSAALHQFFMPRILAERWIPEKSLNVIHHYYRYDSFSEVNSAAN